jgi:hypothetical protein
MVVDRPGEAKPELSAFKLNKHEIDQTLYNLLEHITVERFHPFLLEVGVPLSPVELSALAGELRPWVRSWLKSEVRGRSYESALSKHIRHSKEIISSILGKQKLARFLRWARQCWPYFHGFPGVPAWDSLLYHLVFYTKTCARLPRALYRGSTIRSFVDHLYRRYDKEKNDFEKRLKAHIRAAGPLSEWEVCLVNELKVGRALKKPYKIILAHHHQAFCKFWKALHDALSQSDLEILREWLNREAETSNYSSESLDVVDCACFSRRKRVRL